MFNDSVNNTQGSSTALFPYIRRKYVAVISNLNTINTVFICLFVCKGLLSFFSFQETETIMKIISLLMLSIELAYIWIVKNWWLHLAYLYKSKQNVYHTFTYHPDRNY